MEQNQIITISTFFSGFKDIIYHSSGIDVKYACHLLGFWSVTSSEKPSLTVTVEYVTLLMCPQHNFMKGKMRKKDSLPLCLGSSFLKD